MAVNVPLSSDRGNEDRKEKEGETEKREVCDEDVREKSGK